MGTTWVKKWEVPGSDGEGVWVVGQKADGSYGCSCPVWRFRREECHHILSVKANGGQEVKYRTAMPGNVGEVTVDGDNVLYPLVPIGGSPDLPATIVYDLVRANVSPDQVKDYIGHIFGRGVSLKRIRSHVEGHGRFVYSKFVKGMGWTNPVFTSHDAPLKQIHKPRRTA